MSDTVNRKGLLARSVVILLLFPLMCLTYILAAFWWYHRLGPEKAVERIEQERAMLHSWLDTGHFSQKKQRQ